ncbi:sterol desaturase family protein [Aestuariibacter sp. AA17]|uniref:Sterol desaturase family protein n=1 Tax=Fluctibacter corallii TaxID=2984329 RepID=A0ABT3AAC8_9ALTE|nr:sterol desaturase family protein [Aestuariibacter sp. AA17]MCV2885564.1 sterol desaturase family protein [Aestuariibacter sp. AA17]
MLAGLTEFLQSSVMSLPDYLLSANRRTFGLYLLSACLLAIPAYFVHKKQKTLSGFAGYLFNRRIWLHDSAKLDYGLFIVNRLTRALLWAPIVLTMVPIAMGVSGALESLFGHPAPLTSHPLVVISVFTLLLFLLDDLTRFLLHLAFHKVPMLWEFHKVHHSAKVLTPITIYRTHPLESYLYACRLALAQGIAVGIGYVLFGQSLTMLDVMGANIFVFVFNIMGANLRHSHVRWSWGDIIERWFISPAQHQIHHSDNPKHFDRNLGSALAIWDRLANTLVLSSSATRIRFGLGKHQPHHQTLWACYIDPFKALVNTYRSKPEKDALSSLHSSNTPKAPTID